MAGEAGEASFDLRHAVSWVDTPLVTVCAGSTAIVLLAGLVQVSFGAFTMPISTVWSAVFDPVVWTNPQVLLRLFLGEGFGTEAARLLGLSTAPVDLPKETLIVWRIRMPRVVVAVLVGANLAVSGAVFQAVTRNELASPYILGVSSGAGLAILLTLIVFAELAFMLPLIAAGGGAVAFALVYAIAWKGGTSPVRLVLAGVIVSTVFHSLQTALFFFADDLGVVQTAIAWTTGSLTGVDWAQVRMALPWTLVTVPLTLIGARQLNILLLGERTARSLGMSVERVRFALSGVAVLAAGTAIAVAGIVGFVGLIVPHMVRQLVGSDYKRLVVGSAFAGPALVAVADVGARLALSPAQLPVGILTGLIGGPYFLYLMRRQDALGEL
jgi:iron complex transport system permease protein